MRQAVFLDRDGTLIEEHGYISDLSEVVFYPETVDALQRLKERFKLFIVTNQSGVGEEVITLADVERINGYLTEHLAEHGIQIIQVYVCPHSRNDECSCRKPNPYFLYQAAEEHNIDLAGSYVIGDHPSDVELAENAGARGIYLLTGHGAKHRKELSSNVFVEPGIQQAADFILRHKTSKNMYW